VTSNRQIQDVNNEYKSHQHRKHYKQLKSSVHTDSVHKPPNNPVQQCDTVTKSCYKPYLLIIYLLTTVCHHREPLKIYIQPTAICPSVTTMLQTKLHNCNKKVWLVLIKIFLQLTYE